MTASNDNNTASGVSCSFREAHPLAFKITAAVLAALLFASIVSLFSLRADGETVYSVTSDKSTLTSAPSFGYAITDGIYTSVSGDPQIHLAVNTEKINCVKIYFEKIIKLNDVQLYYSHGGEELSEEKSCSGYLSKDKSHCIVMLPETELDFIRLDIDGSFSLSHAELLMVEKSPVKTALSIPALVLLSLILIAFALALVFEEKTGLRSYIRECFEKQISKISSLLKEGRAFAFVLRILMLVCGALFFVTLTILLMFSVYSPKMSNLIFIFAILFVITFLADRFEGGRENSAFSFLVLTLVIGLTVIFCQPPTIGGSWDEEIHYGRSLSVEAAVFGGGKTLADVYLIDRIESYHTYHSTDISELYGEESRSRLIYADGIELNNGRLNINRMAYINPYVAVSYIPSAFSMALFDALGADILTRVVMPKAANLVLYAAVLYFGLRRLKSGVLMFSAVAMLPTALFIAGSYSYDLIITAFAAYSFIYLISVLQDKDKKIGASDAAHILIPIIIGCAAKAVYFLSAVPLIFVNKDKFESNKARRKIILAAMAVMLIIALSFVLPFLIRTGNYSDNRGGEGIDAAAQLSFIFKNPIKYAGILLNFLRGYISFGNTAHHSGAFAYFGFADSFIGTLSIALVLITAFTDRKENDEFAGSGRIKACLFASVAAQLVLIATSLYISYTPVASGTVAGCQFRYMIPLMFASSCFMGFKGIRNSANKKVYNTVLFALLSFAALGAVYQNLIISF